MSFQSKYLKYKNKYLNLKNIIGGAKIAGSGIGSGGSANANIDANDSPKFIIDLITKNPNLIPYSNSFNIIVISNFVDKYVDNDVIQSNNILSYNLFDKQFSYSRFSSDSILSREIAESYDNISDLYLFSDHFINYWRSISTQFNIDIKIITCQNDSFINYSKNDSNYIIGINILAFCTSDKHAKQLNTKENNENGKYFIGFSNYLHIYGTNFYSCEDVFNCNIEDFISLLNDETNTDYTIIKLIKIFHTYFQECEKCRKCTIINNEVIINKLSSIIPKIRARNKLSDSDSYFKSKDRIKCTRITDSTNACIVDPIYEKWFYDIIYNNNNKILQEKKGNLDKKLQLESIKKKCIETEHNTDITSYYTEIITTKMMEMINNEIYGFYKIDKIYLMKHRENTNNFYFKIVGKDADNDEIEEYFRPDYNKDEIDQVYENGDEIPKNDYDYEEYVEP